MTFEKVLEEIEKQSKISKEELTRKIDSMYNDYSGLVTKEGVAFLLAKELGVTLQNEVRKHLQIKNIFPGMKNVNFVGRVFRISPINEFEKQSGKKGRVVNIFIGDATGYVRLPLWNDQVELVENDSLKVGDLIYVVNGMSQENIYGDVEISLGKFGNIKPVAEDFEFITAEEIYAKYFSNLPARVLIEEIVPGNFEIKGFIVQIFKTNFIFESEGGDKFLVISCVIDDGTGDLRLVFFRELAEKACQISLNELEGLSRDEKYEKITRNLLGKEIIVFGKVKKNKMFNVFEMIADSVKDLNPLEESKRIAEELETVLGGKIG